MSFWCYCEVIIEYSFPTIIINVLTFILDSVILDWTLWCLYLNCKWKLSEIWISFFFSIEFWESSWRHNSVFLFIICQWFDCCKIWYLYALKRIQFGYIIDEYPDHYRIYAAREQCFPYGGKACSSIHIRHSIIFFGNGYGLQRF